MQDKQVTYKRRRHLQMKLKQLISFLWNTLARLSFVCKLHVYLAFGLPCTLAARVKPQWATLTYWLRQSAESAPNQHKLLYHFFGRYEASLELISKQTFRNFRVASIDRDKNAPQRRRTS